MVVVDVMGRAVEGDIAGEDLDLMRVESKTVSETVRSFFDFGNPGNGADVARKIEINKQDQNTPNVFISQPHSQSISTSIYPSVYKIPTYSSISLFIGLSTS